MNIRRKIEFTGKNLHDVFNLPCVKCIIKYPENNPALAIWGDMMNDQSQRTNAVAKIGSVLVEYENGKWQIIK